METPRDQRRAYRKPTLRGLGSMSVVTRKSGTLPDGASQQRQEL